VAKTYREVSLEPARGLVLVLVGLLVVWLVEAVWHGQLNKLKTVVGRSDGETTRLRPLP